MLKISFDKIYKLVEAWDPNGITPCEELFFSDDLKDFLDNELQGRFV